MQGASTLVHSLEHFSPMLYVYHSKSRVFLWQLVFSFAYAFNLPSVMAPYLLDVQAVSEADFSDAHLNLLDSFYV